jgi:hypothetical protein
MCLAFSARAKGLAHPVTNARKVDTMSESTMASTELTSQYTAQVTSDLERNIKEQDRISAEIAALTEQLSGLQHDHAVLVNVQQALGITSAPAEPVVTPDSATVPAPREKTGTQSDPTKRTRGRKADAAQSRTTAGKPAAEKPAGTGKAATAKKTQPTLVELVRSHLTRQSEPRSAAEVATALGQAHPERGIKTTVVRTTLEGLVAKYQAQRTKQGSSVFYTAPETAEPTATTETETQPDQAG